MRRTTEDKPTYAAKEGGKCIDVMSRNHSKRSTTMLALESIPPEKRRHTIGTKTPQAPGKRRHTTRTKTRQVQPFRRPHASYTGENHNKTTNAKHPLTNVTCSQLCLDNVVEPGP